MNAGKAARKIGIFAAFFAGFFGFQAGASGPCDGWLERGFSFLGPVEPGTRALPAQETQRRFEIASLLNTHILEPHNYQPALTNSVRFFLKAGDNTSAHGMTIEVVAEVLPEGGRFGDLAKLDGVKVHAIARFELPFDRRQTVNPRSIVILPGAQELAQSGTQIFNDRSWLVSGNERADDFTRFNPNRLREIVFSWARGAFDHRPIGTEDDLRGSFLSLYGQTMINPPVHKDDFTPVFAAATAVLAGDLAAFLPTELLPDNIGPKVAHYRYEFNGDEPGSRRIHSGADEYFEGRELGQISQDSFGVAGFFADQNYGRSGQAFPGAPSVAVSTLAKSGELRTPWGADVWVPHTPVGGAWNPETGQASGVSTEGTPLEGHYDGYFWKDVAEVQPGEAGQVAAAMYGWSASGIGYHAPRDQQPYRNCRVLIAWKAENSSSSEKRVIVNSVYVFARGFGLVETATFYERGYSRGLTVRRLDSVKYFGLER